MRLARLGCAVLGVSFVLGACGAPARQATPPPTAPAATPANPAPPGDLVVIPPREAPYEEMWRGLRSLETVREPLATESARQLEEALKKHGGSVPAGEVHLQTMVVGDPRRAGHWMVLYTDHRLLKPGTRAIATPVAEALKGALYAPMIDGVAFNPYTTVSRYRVFDYRIDRMYLAGLLGYLQAEPLAGQTHWQAANAAHEAGKPFLALHHALLALDTHEEFKRCEIAKLEVLWELDFPGAREMALKEAEWFTHEPEADDAARTVLERFRAAAQPAEQG